MAPRAVSKIAMAEDALQALRRWPRARKYRSLLLARQRPMRTRSAESGGTGSLARQVLLSLAWLTTSL